jgi:hypothetical protein
MFKSIHYLKYLGFDPKPGLYSSLFKITDDDFEEEIAGAATAHDNVVRSSGAVINCYSKRNLNVPKNLLLLFMFYEKDYVKKHYSIEQQISYCMKYQNLFPKYKEEVEKYLLLM